MPATLPGLKLSLLTICITMGSDLFLWENAMPSQVTVRLPEDLDREVTEAARRLRLRRSDIVRLALVQYLREPLAREDLTPYGKVKHLIGSIRSGVADLGVSHRRHLVARIRRRG
jgi:metal-responsive CopG/Arc/MetJ family transcriptional regulator